MATKGRGILSAESQLRDSNSPPDLLPTRQWPLYVAGGMLVVWILILTCLAASTANPVVVNQLQISLSDAVVTVELGTSEQGQSFDQVVKTWKGEPPEKLPQLSQFSKFPAKTRLVVPLQKTETGWEVTQGPASWAQIPWAEQLYRLPPVTTNLKPLVYVESPDVLMQLETALALPQSKKTSQ